VDKSEGGVRKNLRTPNQKINLIKVYGGFPQENLLFPQFLPYVRKQASSIKLQFFIRNKIKKEKRKMQFNHQAGYFFSKAE